MIRIMIIIIKIMIIVIKIMIIIVTISNDFVLYMR